MPRVLSSVLVLLLIGFTAHAEQAQEHTLRYKFETGDVIRYEVEHNASVRSTMDGTSQKAITRSESIKAWKVIDVLPSGDIELQNVVERVKMTNRLPDRAEMKFDSTSAVDPPPGFEDAAQAIGVPLSHVRITPWGKVLDHEVKHQQPAADPHAPLAVLLPEEPVAVGDTWDDPIDIQVRLSEGGTKMVKTRRHFRLKAVQRGVATIAASHQVLSPITPEVEGQLAQRLMEGVVRFDIAKGRVLSQEFEVDKRVLGFAGPSSSMHYQMKMLEKLQERTTVASRP